jgi:signal transduction histidine kinase
VLYHYPLEANLLTLEAGVNLAEEFETLGQIPTYTGGAFQAMFDRQPYVINEIKTHLGRALNSPAVNQWDARMRTWFEAIVRHYDAYLGIPLIIQGEIYGSLGLYFSPSRQFQKEEIELAVAFGDQTALSIENAQLSSQVRLTAVQAERNRLARDLHDAVTQTLFSASLVAEVLPKLWEMNPEAGRKKLDELRKLTRGALSEMRTMLMELRPSALVEADIEDLFRHLVNAFVARSMLSVQFDVQGDEDPPVPVKEVFYRIMQEALNNIEKHAGAQQVEIKFTREPGDFKLVIRDDGCGFDPEAVSKDHLGLGIMHERARNIGALLTIISSPMIGTELSLHWTAKIEEAE